MSDYENSLLNFHMEEPMDTLSRDKDSVILDDIHEEEPDNLSVSQSNSDLLNKSQCVRVINMSQGDNVSIRFWNTASHQKVESDGVHSDPESQTQDQETPSLPPAQKSPLREAFMEEVELGCHQSWRELQGSPGPD